MNDYRNILKSSAERRFSKYFWVLSQREVAYIPTNAKKLLNPPTI
jgi:hypothetical protein